MPRVQKNVSQIQKVKSFIGKPEDNFEVVGVWIGGLILPEKWKIGDSIKSNEFAFFGNTETFPSSFSMIYALGF